MDRARFTALSCGLCAYLPVPCCVLLTSLVQLVVVFGFPYDKQFAGFWRVSLLALPPNLLAIGLKYPGGRHRHSQDPA